MKINKIPSPTWRWLKLNFSDVSLNEPKDEKVTDDKARKMDRIAEIPTGLGEEAAAFFAMGDISVISDCDKSLGYEISGEPQAHTVVISVPDNRQATVVMTVTGDGEGTLGLRTIYAVGKGAKLNLVQVIMGGKKSVVLNDLGGAVDDGGRFVLQQIFLDGAAIYAGDYTYLHGERSSFDCDIAYRCVGDGELDMNYTADHTGKKSDCNIRVNGVLFDRSQKIFRGTIDFKRGCAGAKGAEIEDVLLMDEEVRNRTIPVILCKEEDVEGSHGASIGRLDEDLMFYLQSRGVCRDDIYAMMANARIDALRRRLLDNDAARLVADKLKIEE